MSLFNHPQPLLIKEGSLDDPPPGSLSSAYFWQEGLGVVKCQFL